MKSKTYSLLSIVLLAASLLAQSRPGGGQDRRRGWNERPSDLKNFDYEVKSFESPSLKRTSQYGVFLPKGYSDEKNRTKQYPLVVWLHGLWEDHQRFHGRGESGSLDKALGDGVIPELIFVTPNGGNSFYLNGKESGPYEDLITKDLLAEIESKYRVAKRRDQRVLMGNSMGGGGAIRIAFKHPELFGTVATHSAALFPVDPESIPERHRRILYGEGQSGFGLSRIFGVPPDLEMWKQENPLYLAETLDNDKLQGLKIYFDCGGNDRYQFHVTNKQLHELLEKRKIKHTWRLVPDGGHGTQYATANLPESLRFVGMALGVNAAKSGLDGLLDGDRKNGDGNEDKRPDGAASKKSRAK